MATVNVVDVTGKVVGEVTLSDEVFGQEVNEGLIYDVLKAQLASKRVGSANTRNRALVVGSKKKMYRQKGTGRARHGGVRAPTFVGGGTVHGPTPRDYGYRPPKKMRRGAMRSALSLRAGEGRLIVVDSLALEGVKTKRVVEILAALGVPKSSVIVDAATNERLKLSARNLKKHLVLPAEGVNLYDLLRHEHLLVTKDALGPLTERFLDKTESAEAAEAAE